MQVRFWGTRGSIAKPGPATIRYGGNTSCVEVRTNDGQLLVLDCGTGGHDLGRKLMVESPRPGRGSLLISHTHWDHIQGIPFFAPLFVLGWEWDIYAPQGFGETLRTTLAGQMEYTYFPITPDAFGASIRYHNLSEGTFRIGNVRIETRYLNHPALTIAYRLEADGTSLVYACDHEPHAPAAAQPGGPIESQDAAHAAFLRRADLVMHDAQYTAEEYETKAGWGHGTIDYAINVAEAADVRTLALTHHEPVRTDDEIDALLAKARARLTLGSRLQVIAAAEGTTIALEPTGDPGPTDEQKRKEEERDALRALASGRTALVVTEDDLLFERFVEVACDEGLTVSRALDEESGVAGLRDDDPPLALIDGALPPSAVATLLRTSPDVPKLLVGGNLADQDWDRVEHISAGFTREYLRSRIRTWLMRGKFAGVPACIPESEARRLATVRAIDILDTPAEERFDRYTRIAARLFDVPVSLISILDTDRQWFKSRVGTDLAQTPRGISFCAHAILEPRPLVIPDAVQDPRFAANPLVVGPPRIRFYAGTPLHVGGEAVGTLCLIDFRPRQLNAEQLRMLRDLGRLVEAEIAVHRIEDSRRPATAPSSC